tara:strand:+ start:168 stop:629 length:462 start_codon:yes stop_codon:yes gene_type:complete
VKLSQDALLAHLANWPVARLATVDATGTPHQVPIVFVWHADRLWSPVDGKAKRGGPLKRIQNAQSNPAGSLLLDHYDENWSKLWWIRVNVALQVINLESTDFETIDQGAKAEASRAVVALQDKYPQYQTTPVLVEPPTLLLMTPTAFNSWQAD